LHVLSDEESIVCGICGEKMPEDPDAKGNDFE
jgi:hypothetical protein